MLGQGGGAGMKQLVNTQSYYSPREKALTYPGGSRRQIILNRGTKEKVIFHERGSIQSLDDRQEF